MSRRSRTRAKSNATWGKLNEHQSRVVRGFVQDQHVSDLGAGDLTGSEDLVRLGARAVSAFDQSPMGEPPPKIYPDYRNRRYSQLWNWGRSGDPQAARDWFGSAAYLSWPSANLTGWVGDPGCELRALIKLLDRIPVVIYLGKNTDGTACGTVELFKYLTSREVLAEVPDRRNSLIVYGPRKGRRPLLAEEIAGTMGKVIGYDESHKMEQSHRGRR